MLRAVPSPPVPAGRNPFSLEAMHLELRLWLRAPDSAAFWPADGLLLHRLPFVIGRLPAEDDHAPRSQVDLRLPDRIPYRLCRVHFCILRYDGRPAIMDTNSRLGTRVNGVAIGRGQGRNHLLLNRGMNRIGVGGSGDCFEFDLLVSGAGACTD